MNYATRMADAFIHVAWHIDRAVKWEKANDIKVNSATIQYERKTNPLDVATYSF